MEKLSYYGLDQAAMAWIKSYLSHRSFYVAIGFTQSNIKSLIHGVPQGSMLGPLLYLIYINNFPSILECDDCVEQLHTDRQEQYPTGCNHCGNFPIFADDGQYLVRSNSRNANQDSIERMFVTIKDNLNSIGLKVNKAKTGLMEFMIQQKLSKIHGIPPNLTVSEIIHLRGSVSLIDKHITDSKYQRFLGLNIENGLTWDSQLSTGKQALLPACRKILGIFLTITLT